MKRKKNPEETVKVKMDAAEHSKVTRVQKAAKNVTEVDDIKRKVSKVNLYLSLVNKNLFVTVGIDEVDLAAEIEAEVNEFLISKAKSVFSGEGNLPGFSNTELTFLKLLSRKGTEVKATEKVEVVPEVSVTPEPEPVKVKAAEVIKATPVTQVTPKQSSKPNTVKKVVSIIKPDGTPESVEIETEKIVMPPPSIKRNPPATFEQQAARAAADVAAVQRALSVSGPLVVDSSDSEF